LITDQTIIRLTLFILGLNWGEVTYPWKSAAIISTIVIGFLCIVALFIYESKATLKEPLIPMHIVLNKDWGFSVLVLAIGASIYYSMAIVWPQMAAAVYNDCNQLQVAWISCASASGTTFGAIFSGATSRFVGKAKLQCIIAITIGGALIAGYSHPCIS
jgi:hypothetical protein